MAAMVKRLSHQFVVLVLRVRFPLAAPEKAYPSLCITALRIPPAIVNVRISTFPQPAPVPCTAQT